VSGSRGIGGEAWCLGWLGKGEKGQREESHSISHGAGVGGILYQKRRGGEHGDTKKRKRGDSGRGSRSRAAPSEERTTRRVEGEGGGRLR